MSNYDPTTWNTNKNRLKRGGFLHLLEAHARTHTNGGKSFHIIIIVALLSLHLFGPTIFYILLPSLTLLPSLWSEAEGIFDKSGSRPPWRGAVSLYSFLKRRLAWGTSRHSTASPVPPLALLPADSHYLLMLWKKLQVKSIKRQYLFLSCSPRNSAGMPFTHNLFEVGAGVEVDLMWLLWRQRQSDTLRLPWEGRKFFLLVRYPKTFFRGQGDTKVFTFCTWVNVQNLMLNKVSSAIVSCEKYFYFNSSTQVKVRTSASEIYLKVNTKDINVHVNVNVHHFRQLCQSNQ